MRYFPTLIIDSFAGSGTGRSGEGGQCLEVGSIGGDRGRIGWGAIHAPTHHLTNPPTVSVIPRHVVSHFRNYGDGLKPEQAAKLRDWLESKGVEFTDEVETPAVPQPTGEQPSNQQPFKLPFILSDDGLTQRTALVCRHFFVDERFTDDQLKSAGKCVEKSFEQAKELLGVELVSKWASNEYDEATDAKLRELWGHLASIGLVSLLLQGRLLINKTDQERLLTTSLSEGDKQEPRTLGDLLFNSYSKAVAGLNPSGQPEQVEDEEEEATS